MKPPTASSAVPSRQLARKTYTLQLPLQLAARFEALCEMYPQKSQAELLADLLGLGLAQLEQSWPRRMVAAGDFHPDKRQPIYLLTGPFDEFHGLVRKHHGAMARELDRDEPEPLHPLDDYLLGPAG